MRAPRIARNALSRILAMRGWTDVDLAMRAGLSRAHVNRVKNRRARPTIETALRISRALDRPVEAIFLLD